MDTSDTYSPSLSVAVVYSDPPDLIELETRVATRQWGGSARAYDSPDSFRRQALTLESWCRHLKGEAVVEAGADTGIGWSRLRFYRTDNAGHVVCHVTLATGGLPSNYRRTEVWRLSLEFQTEAGLVEQFARSLRLKINSLNVPAVLKGVIG